MATIQIADKPTLDAIKALLESSGGVNGYQNVSLRTVKSVKEAAGATSLNVTGTGKALVLGGSSSFAVDECLVDGADISDLNTSTNVRYMPMHAGMELCFARSLKITGRNGSPSTQTMRLLLYLEN